MKLFSNVGIRLREHNGAVIAVLAGLSIALAAFFTGTWAGSSGLLALTANPAQAAGRGGMHSGQGCCGGPEKPASSQTSEPPSPSHQMPGGDQMPGATHPGDTHQMPGGDQMPGATHPGGMS
jgi:hypothetical protein